jgi:hypothetical protein
VGPPGDALDRPAVPRRPRCGSGTARAASRTAIDRAGGHARTRAKARGRLPARRSRTPQPASSRSRSSA